MNDDSWDPLVVIQELRSKPILQLPKTSLGFYNQNCEDWMASRKRLLVSALANGDREQFSTTLNEYAAICVNEEAIRIIITIWERLIRS